MIDCAECGFAHLWPKPTAEELAEYYAQSFYETHSAPDWAEKEEKEQPYWELEYADRLAAFFEILQKPTGKLLDVGCGSGWFLAWAKAHGWEVLGIEPSQSMWEQANSRAPVLLGTFPDVDVRSHAPFDAVHVKLVMEHVAEPLEVLAAVRDVLCHGGIVAVQVPNDFNPVQLAAQRLLNKDPWWIVHPVHVNYFNFESLERTLRPLRLRAARTGSVISDGVVSAAGDRLHRSRRCRAPVSRATHEVKEKFGSRWPVVSPARIFPLARFARHRAGSHCVCGQGVSAHDDCLSSL